MESRIYDLVKAKLTSSGWNSKEILEGEIYYTEGRIYSFDIILIHKLNPIAVVEIKGGEIDMQEGLFQAVGHFDSIKIPHVFLTNGTDIFQVSSTRHELIKIDKFPAPNTLWNISFPDITKNDPRNIEPVEIETTHLRLYQIDAINRLLSAIPGEKNYLYIRMDKGTGKTIVALESCWKLLKSHRYKRALYITDTDPYHIKDMSSRFEWKVDILSAENISQNLDVYVTSLKKAFTNTNIHDLLDRETVIFIDVGNFSIDREIFPDEFQKGNLQSKVVLFTAIELPWEMAKLFGPPVFSYSHSESLFNDIFQIPDGFEARKLDEISEIRLGQSPDRINDDTGKSVILYVVKGRDIGKDNGIDFETLSTITKRLPEGKLNDILLVHKNDILISTMPIRGKFSVVLFPEENSKLITYSIVVF